MSGCRQPLATQLHDPGVAPGAVRRAWHEPGPHLQSAVGEQPAVALGGLEGTPRDHDADHASLGRVAARVHVSLGTRREDRHPADGLIDEPAQHARIVGGVQQVVRPQRRGMAAVVHVGRDRPSVEVVEPGHHDPVVNRPAVGAPVGADPRHLADADGGNRLASLLPGAGDRVGDAVADGPLRIRGLRQPRSAVGMRADQLEALPGDPGSREHLVRRQRLQPWIDLEQVCDHQRDGRAVRALDDERTGEQRVVDARRAVHPHLEALELHSQRRRDIDLRGSDLHSGSPPSTTARPVRSAS